MTWLQELVSYANSRLTDREREVLCSRGVSNEQMDTFQIGYLNKELPKGVSDHFLRWSQHGKKLDDVLVFPLTTALGEVRGVQFRNVCMRKEGYTDYFLDRRETCLFGMQQAIKSIWENNSVFLVEGCFDLFPIQRAIPYIVSTMTSHVGNQSVRLFRRFVDRVWLGFDTDAPGQKGGKEFLERHGQDFEVYIVKYPTVLNGRRVKDPGEIWEEWGDSQMIPFIHSEIEQHILFC